MSSSISTSEPLDPHLAASIARAEHSRAVLERLTEAGMRIVGEIEERMVNSPYHPEPRHEPGRAFAAVARSVRLTLAFEARIDRDILAMRKGRFPPGEAVVGGATASACLQTGSETATPAFGTVPDNGPRRARGKVRDAVWAAIDRESGDVETADVARGRLHERLIEGEAYDAFLSRPWRECVAAICADLGLSPDWSDWSDDAEFPPAAEGRRERVDAESG